MTTVDFLNNAAAVCVVVLFAKFVTHRTRPSGNPRQWHIVLHLLCIAFAAFGLVTALNGAEAESDWWILHAMVWAGTILAAGLLLTDVLSADVPQWPRRTT
jgi:hypothetical protein